MRTRFNWKEVTGITVLEGHWLKRKYFSPAVLQQLAQRIKQAEEHHSGELVLAVEAVSPLHEPDSHARALEVFGRLRVWDTPHNTGVLLYLALDKHHIHIVADRGISAPDTAWDQICRRLQDSFRQGRFAQGLDQAIDAIEGVLRQHTPRHGDGPSTPGGLPDAPVML